MEITGIVDEQLLRITNIKINDGDKQWRKILIIL